MGCGRGSPLDQVRTRIMTPGGQLLPVPMAFGAYDNPTDGFAYVKFTERRFSRPRKLGPAELHSNLPASCGRFDGRADCPRPAGCGQGCGRGSGIAWVTYIIQRWLQILGCDPNDGLSA